MFDHLGFNVGDLAKSLAFYEAALQPLSAALVDGLEAVEAAAVEALKLELTGAEVVLNILARSRAAPTAPTIETPDRLKLTIEPKADAARYDQLRRITRAA